MRRDKLNKATVEYDLVHPIMSEKEWDELYWQLQKLEDENNLILPASPTRRVLDTPIDQLKKVYHTHPMLSLDKTKEWQDVVNFSQKNTTIAMCKMDGLTCSLTYIGGVLFRAETRGNGAVGEDITHNAYVIPSIPKVLPEKVSIVVDGEIICKYSDFEEFASEYKHPRNFAAGSIRLLNPKTCYSRKLTFVAWDLIESDKMFDTLHQNLVYLNSLGFTVTPMFEVHATGEADVEMLESMVKSFADMCSYPIDGIVLKYDDCAYYRSLGSTEHHFRGGLAYKFYDEEYETVLRDIDWTMSRNGVLTPVAVYDPIEIDGTECTRASLHNVTIMYEQLYSHPYKGEHIFIAKKNQIIPQVVRKIWKNDEWNKDNELVPPAVCPVCGEKTELIGDHNSLFLHCSNPDCSGKLINQLDHFCSKKGLDIKGLSKNTLEKLIIWGYVSSIPDLFSLSTYRDEWRMQDGFGDKSVDNILAAIENARHPQLYQFISSLGIPLIGITYAKQLCEIFSTYQEFRNAIGTFNFYEIDGFGIQMHEAITNFDYSIADELVNKGIIICEQKKEESQSQELQGLTFVVTGKLHNFKNRDELKKLVESRGGKVVGSVSKNTSYLINNDINSTSAKNQSAKNLNIPIITEEEFLAL